MRASVSAPVILLSLFILGVSPCNSDAVADPAEPEIDLHLIDVAHSKAGGPVNILSKEEKAAGWQLLFDGKTTKEWRTFKRESFPTNGWVIEDGWLHGLGKGGGDIITKAQFANFELQWDWKQVPAGNSGLKYFVTETRESAIGHEYQLIDEAGEPDAKRGEGKRITAAF